MDRITAKRLLKKVACKTLPSRVATLLKEMRGHNPAFKVLCDGNVKFKNIHIGKRCFIICNGPSIKKQNLLPLKNEIVFMVSSGYHHKDYLTIKPRYHCTPQITYSEACTKNVAIDFLKEMESKTGDAELFFSASDELVIRENKLFYNRKVNYVWFGANFAKNKNEIIDISKMIPGVQTVPIMCIMIALYMGFKTIYLLGAEHDSHLTLKYEYFFEPTVLKGKDVNVSADNKTIDREKDFRCYLILCEQYEILKNIAEANGAAIYNATLGGVLEKFKRVSLADVLD